MCGILGQYNLNQAPIFRAELKHMLDTMQHRGPDGEDIFIREHVGLGHRRLSILDLSDRGSQPMTSKNGDWVITFNGCIYNYLELKQELRSKGHEFRSTSDTEVIVEGLVAYGASFFERLNGMFAIGAYHKSEDTIYLSRDRFGVKPLYYWFNGESLVFASEIKAIIAHPKYQIGLNTQALNEYFTFQNLFTFRTLFKGVMMLPPANTVKVDRSSREITHQSWWDYDFSQTDENMSFDEAKEETERLFKQAVARQMAADVPVGSYLSGGMDSGSIAAIASQHVPRLTTFTCGFDMSEVTGVEANYDERRDAELMANAFKTEHFEQVINAGDLRWSLPKVVGHLEDLRVGMSYPNYYIARLASKFVKVCLQGTGGDELYGGYPWRYYRVFQSLNQQDFFNQYYGFWQRLVSDEDKPKLFKSQIIREMDLGEPRRVFERVFTFNDKLRYDTPEDHINNSLYFEIKTFLPGLLLVGDKLSMASGLEERFPFLDNDLVDFAMKVPVKHKLANLNEKKSVNENLLRKHSRYYKEFDDGKNVLRRAMQDFMPDSILNRNKQGFSAPDESWYRGENVNYIKELLLKPKAHYNEYIDQKFVKKVVNQHLEGKANNRLLIWSLMSFEWWCKIYLDGDKSWKD